MTDYVCGLFRLAALYDFHRFASREWVTKPRGWDDWKAAYDLIAETFGSWTIITYKYAGEPFVRGLCAQRGFDDDQPTARARA